PKGWRFNGQQYPNAIHMAVTRPQTQPGVVAAFAADLDDAVEYAKKKTAAGEPAVSAAIYGGIPGGLTTEGAQFIEAMMEQMLDTQQSVPPVS
ncbi:MAG TPA: aspartate aminotransferase family protein, partial [Mycobacterium sp.]|nr:aspartate aminotransferase family protein [Mycobacterium sp.]